MRFVVEAITENPVSLMRRAGYTFQREEGGEMSFVRVFGSSGYPRLHAYVKLEKINMGVNLHLDQKKHTYGEGTRHHGEYENEGAVKEEMDRLRKVFGDKMKIV